MRLLSSSIAPVPFLAGLSAFAVMLLAAFPARSDPPAAAPESPVGLWLTADRDGVVEIDPCGNSLCGRIVGVSPGTSPRAPAPQDGHGRPLCGLTIMGGFKPNASGEWVAGWIVNPEDDRTYKAQLGVAPDGTLSLRGYIGISLFGSTESWTRYQGHIGRDCLMG